MMVTRTKMLIGLACCAQIFRNFFAWLTHHGLTKSLYNTEKHLLLPTKNLENF